jgi:hypothetical protein
MRFSAINKAVRTLVLGSVLLVSAAAAPVALATGCIVKIPPGCWVCTCDKDCACVCTQC